MNDNQDKPRQSRTIEPESTELTAFSMLFTDFKAHKEQITPRLDEIKAQIEAREEDLVAFKLAMDAVAEQLNAQMEQRAAAIDGVLASMAPIMDDLGNHLAPMMSLVIDILNKIELPTSKEE